MEMKLVRPLFIAALLVPLPTLRAADAPKPSSPNVLIILADDLGYGDVGCYNPKSTIPTPNLDRLAREGMRFTDAHSATTVCTPSRYSLMTGQMAFRVPRGGRVFAGVGGPSLIAPGRLTLPEMLRAQGYETGAVGKWHIGLTFRDKNGRPISGDGLKGVEQVDYSRRVEGGPLEHGFDYFFGTACCPTTDWLYAYIEGDRIPVPPTGLVDKSKFPTNPYTGDFRGGMLAPNYNLEEVDLEFLKQSRAFLERHVKTEPDKPFFLYHATAGVHLATLPADRFKGKTQSGPQGDYIFEFDSIVGELMKTLEQLKLADNTLVIITSDNGPETVTTVHMREDYHHDGARPWRGMKRDDWEGGHRVPFIVYWPGHVKPGRTSDQLISQTDIMATVAAIVGAKLPDDAAEDSYNLLPALLGETHEQIRPYLLEQAFYGARYLSIRRGNWKLLDHQGSGGNNYNTPLLKRYALKDTEPDAPGQLFDLANDPGEKTNVYNEHPEIVQALKATLDDSKRSGRSAPHRANPARAR